MHFTIDIEDYTASDTSSSPTNSNSADSSISSLHSSPIRNQNRRYEYSPSSYSSHSNFSENTASTYYYMPEARAVFENRNIISNAIPLNHNIEEAQEYNSDSESDNSSLESHNVLFFEGELKGCKMTLFIIFILFLFFIINCSINNSFNNGYDNFYLLIFRTLSDYPNCYPLQNEVWRIVTNSLIHYDLAHLISNTLYIFLIGHFLENIVGYKYLLIYFFLSIFGGTLSIAYINRYTLVFGASHGAMGLSGALLGKIILNYDILKKKIFYMLFIFSSFGLIIDILSYNFLYHENIAYVSHWIGYTNGFLLSTYFSKIVNTNNWKTFIKITSLNIFIVLNFYLLFDYFHYKYKTNVMNEELKEINFNNCCLEYIKNNFQHNFTCV